MHCKQRGLTTGFPLLAPFLRLFITVQTSTPASVFRLRPLRLRGDIWGDILANTVFNVRAIIANDPFCLKLRCGKA